MEKRPMPTGRLHLEPWGPNGPARGWAAIACDPGWFELNRALGRFALGGTWRRVVDTERFDGGRVDSPRLDTTPRLALVPEPLAAGRWGPHISVTRAERPARNEDLWGARAAVTRAVEDLAHHRETFELIQTRHTNLVNSLAAMGPVRPKVRAQAEAPLPRMVEELAQSRGRVQRAEHLLRQATQEWARMARARRDIPGVLHPDVDIEFTLLTDLNTDARHWWYRVECPAVAEIRVFFGLSSQPKWPPHLTIAVAEERGEPRRPGSGRTAGGAKDGPGSPSGSG